MSPRPFPLLLAALLLLSPAVRPATAAPESTLGEEEWGIIEFGGKRVGFVSTVTTERETAQGRQFVTTTHEEFKIARMGTTLHIISDGKVTEDAKGKVINFETIQQGAGTNKRVRGYRVGEQLVVVSGADKRNYDVASDALGPAAVERLLQDMPLKEGAHLAQKSFLAELPHSAVNFQVTNQGRQDVDIDGKTQNLWKMLTTVDVMPGMDTLVYADDEGTAKLTVMPIAGLGEFRVVTATKEEATREMDAAEMFVQTLVEPDRALPNYRSLRSVTYQLSTAAGKGVEVYDGDNQKRLDSFANSTTLRVTVPSPDSLRPTYRLPYPGGTDMEDYLGASSYIENTPTIRTLAKRAVGGEKNPQEAARKIERFVRHYISAKDLSVSFASAEETAQSRAGDCSEHAVLCAALARAVGLPSRVVTGLGYLPTDYSGQGTKGTGNFGFHMWAEAYMGNGKWQTMDAALDGLTVGHIALTKTALTEANPTVELGMPIFNILGGLNIKVIDVQ